MVDGEPGTSRPLWNESLFSEPLTRGEELSLRGLSYGLTQEETAAALGVTPSDVGRAVFSAIEKVHEVERSRTSGS